MKNGDTGASTHTHLDLRSSDRIGIGVYFVAIVLLLLYSFTQIDLNLTISTVPLVTRIVDVFRYVGYFNRPLSTVLFAIIILALTAGYIWLIHMAKEGRLSRQWLTRIVIGTPLLLLVSYPAFSYDFFNYLFTSRTVLLYHANPYTVIPLSYMGVDPYLSFMRWTHLTSAYTPMWILLSLVPYLVGLNFFITEVVSLKALLALSYVIVAFGIWKIQKSEGDSEAALSVILFACNPLVIIESLVSSHNDIAMMAVAILSLVLSKKKVLSFFMLSVSVSLKMMTFFLLPAFFFHWNRILAFVGMILALVVVSFTREPLAWYMLWVIPFASLVPKKRWLIYSVIAASLGFLVRYMPYLYLGNWDPPVMYYKNVLSSIAVFLTFGIFAIDHVIGKKTKRIKLGR